MDLVTGSTNMVTVGCDRKPRCFYPVISSRHHRGELYVLAVWSIDKYSLSKWKRLVDEQWEKKLPQHRYQVNVKRIGIDLSKGSVWRALVGCQVTTQQRSGPKSGVSRFLKSSSPALSIAACRSAANLSDMLERELNQAGLRRAPTIATNLVTIYNHLEAGEWKELAGQLATLETRPTLLKERSVVNYLLGGKYPGLGQKQSRNFIQWVGVSRYEVPLDSRVLKRMQTFGASFVPSGSALTDEAVYLFVQDCLQQVASALNIYPCMLDACIFSSFDVDDDTESDETDA